MLRKPQFVPDTKRVRELLREFIEQKSHVAIVLDEYGGTSGLVTVEDVIEEIMGDIADEHDDADDEAGAGVTRGVDGTYEVDARLHTDDLNERLSLDLPEDEAYDTIGGLITTTLGRIPRSGEVIELSVAHLEVVAADDRRVITVRIRPTAPQGAPSKNS
jgi:magnesium and cobalt transporter